MSQLQRLGWPESKKSLYKLLSKLRELAFIDRHTYRFNPKIGSTEDIYYLRTKGLNYLKDRRIPIKGIKVPSSKSIFYDDYVHRKRCIDCQISLCQYFLSIGMKPIHYLHYFETIINESSGRRHTATKITYDQGTLKSDAVCKLSHKGSDILFLLEMHNGNRVQKMVDTIKSYAQILSQGSASEQFQSKRNPRIFLVFEKSQTLKSVQEQVSLDRYYTYLFDYYWFAFYDDLMVTPGNCRINMAGQNKTISSLFLNKK